MKKKIFFKNNENIIIYVVTAVFLIIAISVGISMYMKTGTNQEISENTEKGSDENNLKSQEIEDVSSGIGKTIEEQENKPEEQEVVQPEETNIIVEKPNSTEKKDEKDSKITEPEETEKQPEVKEEKEPISFIKPTDGEIITEFAQENLIYSETLKEWITHTGIDIKADKTSIIKASADGIITSILNDPRYGLTIVMTHDDGYETVYSNLLTAEFVVEGEEVKQGQTIGTAGNTAAFESNLDSHLHFEILQDGKYLNPSIYLK